jgi:hypothetical protein
MNTFFRRLFGLKMRIPWDDYLRNSIGWWNDPIAKVHTRIFLGGSLSVDLYIFQKFNITHAINCATNESNSKWFKLKFPERYECMEAEDSETFDITSSYPKFEETMNRFLADPECKNVYVHCQCGINRSAFLLAIYMCKKFRYKLDMVVKHILSQRPCCFQNTYFREQVEEYIKKLDVE